MIKAAPESNPLQRRFRTWDAILAWNLGEAHWQLDVFQHGHGWNEVERLEDHAHSIASVQRQFLARHACEVAAGHLDRTSGGRVQAGDQIEQGRLAGSRAAEHSDKLASGDVETNPVHGANFRVSHAIGAGKLVRLDGGALFRLWIIHHRSELKERKSILRLRGQSSFAKLHHYRKATPNALPRIPRMKRISTDNSEEPNDRNQKSSVKSCSSVKSVVGHLMLVFGLHS